MRFARTELHLDCSALTLGNQHGRATALARLAGQAAELLHRHGFVIFRIGRLRLGIEESRTLAAELATQLLRELVRRGAPENLRLEQDQPQETFVPAGFATRTLLPHHDGQHCSYLTPSQLDDDSWVAEWRTFGSTGYTTTPAHKMYQGVFIADPGEGLSVTTYYDWLDVLTTVWTERGGDAGTDPSAVARWLGGNVRLALDYQTKHGCPYPSVGGLLGLSEPLWHGLSFHHAEAELSGEDRSAYPMAAPLAAACPCGNCAGDMARLFCYQILQATGRNWSQFRQSWEVLAPSERFDLLFGHNLTMLHGGLSGGPGRVIEPFCLVVDNPVGQLYEEWLAASWRRRLPGMTT